MKIIAVITVLLTAAVSFYIIFAIDKFKKDKSATIYEDSLSNASALANRTKFFLKSSHDAVLLMAQTYKKSSNAKVVSDIFRSNTDLLEFSIYKNRATQFRRSFHLYDKDILESYDLPKSYFKKLGLSKNIPLDKIKTSGLFLENVSLPGGIPHFLMGLFDKSTNEIYTIRINSSRLSKIFQKAKKFKSFIVTNMGQAFLDDGGKVVFANVGGSINEYLTDIVGGEITEGVKRFSDRKTGAFLSAFSKISLFNLFVISEISESSAFSAADELVNMSFYFGILILSLAVITGVFFSQRITHHLSVLFKATQQIAEGDFASEVNVSSKDEIGALSDSFNFMSKEIVRYMDEMKEKARLENEVKVAQLVQNSFFPNDDIQIGGLDVAAFYTPASECGGDWWGAYEIGNKVLLIIADATGHGVPAALLTATANCCANNIKLMSKSNSSLYNSPDKIMEIMNHAVCSIGSEIMMTCFVGLFDKSTGVFQYSNASHNPPFLFENKEGPVDKSHFLPLMEANGPRLGHEKDASYSSAEVSLKVEDALVLFTDGILEAENTEEKQYGQRRFLKSLIANIRGDVSTCRDAIVKDAYDFYQDVPPNDDLTLVVTKFSKSENERENGNKPKIKVLSRDGNLQDSVKEQLSSINVQYSLNFGFEEADAIVVGSDKELSILPNEQWEKLASKIIVLTHRNDEENVSEILAKYPVRHVVGLNSANTNDEISRCIGKIIGSPNWGVEQYIGEGQVFKKMDVRKSADVKSIVDEALSEFNFEKYFDSPRDYLRLLGNELMTNALYHSGKDYQTFLKRSGQDRKENIEIGEDEAIEFSVGMSPKYIAISVCDKSGRLDRKTLVNSLVRSFTEQSPENKSGGAGLGLYMAFQNANQFVVNVIPNEKTEVICIIDTNKRFKKYRERITSFHYYLEGSNE